VLPNVDYLVASSEFPSRWTQEPDPYRAAGHDSGRIRHARRRHDAGRRWRTGSRGWRFLYSPGFAVHCVDTTGAGDVFHGAFCYSVIESMPVREALEFSNAMAALNCTALGARGHIASLSEAQALMQSAGRRSNPAFEQRDSR